MSMFNTSMFEIRSCGYIEHRYFLFSMVRKSMLLGFHSPLRPLNSTKRDSRPSPDHRYRGQCSRNVDVSSPYHRCFQLIMSPLFNQPMAVERGRSHELVGSMVGAVYVHVLWTLTGTNNKNDLRTARTGCEVLTETSNQHSGTCTY